MEDLEQFLKELSELSKKHGLILEGTIDVLNKEEDTYVGFDMEWDYHEQKYEVLDN